MIIMIIISLNLLILTFKNQMERCLHAGLYKLQA